MELQSLSFKSLPLFHNPTKALTRFFFLPCLQSPFFPPRLRRNSGGKSRRLPASKPQNTDEFPVDEYDETYMSELTDKKEELTEEEFRRRNWTERGWAPWEEVLTPEAEFTRKSLDEGEEIPLETPEAIEAFKMLTAKYRREKMEESGMSEEEWKKKQFEIKGDIPDPLKTEWNFPVVLLKIPPRDWPPRGWRVDKRELAFIREAHKLQALRVDARDVENAIGYQEASFERYEVFLKQYNVYVEMNRERLEEEAFEVDQDYYPGRRKRGKDYEEDMYELPFIFPGQICAGKVTSVHLHQGAFVDFGCVHDGWVPIRGNDWYWIRHHIKVGMNVVVEVLAKRDPYRFRFPIEMRLVYPNIDHLIFNKFEFPPAFHRDTDTNPEQFARDSGRPPVPRKRTKEKFEEQSLLLDHPHVPYVWQLHVAEQMILDDEEQNPEKYKNKINASGSVEEAPFNEEERVQYTEKYFKKALIPHVILNTNVKELDMDAARAERQMNNRLREEAEERGEKFEVEKLRRNMEMDDLNFIHWRRSFEEREALIRDISCRRALDLPVEEPERYKDKSFFPKKYDPSDPFYRYDYWGVPKGSKEDKEKQKEIDRHKSIVGNGFVWSDRSYEDLMKQNEFHKNKEAQERQMSNEAVKVEGSSNTGNSNSNSSELPVVNGKEVFDK